MRGPCFFRRESHWATCSQSLAPHYFESKYPAATDVLQNVEFTFNGDFSKQSGRGDCGYHTPRVTSNHSQFFFQIKPRLLSLGILLSIREHLQPTLQWIPMIQLRQQMRCVTHQCLLSGTDWHHDTVVLRNIRSTSLTLPELGHGSKTNNISA